MPKPCEDIFISGQIYSKYSSIPFTQVEFGKVMLKDIFVLLQLRTTLVELKHVPRYNELTSMN